MKLHSTDFREVSFKTFSVKCLPVLISGAFMNEEESCLEGARTLSCGKLEDEIEPGWNYIFKMSVTLEPRVADRLSAFRSLVDFCQTLSVERDLLDLFVQPLLLDMIFLGTHQLRGGVYV